jgi:hypothetical protein
MKVRRSAFASVAVVPTLVAAALVVALVAVIGSAQAAAPATKPYTAWFDETVAGGAETIDLVLTNDASPQALGSANVTAQSGFEFTGGATFDGAGDVDETSTTTVLKLRNLNILPNASRTITMNVTTPCSADEGDEWGIRAKQSNDFSGTPGNDFSLDLANSNLHTDVGGTGGTPAELSFRQQPTDSDKLAAIAPPVEVEVLDTCGNTTNPSGDVTLTLIQPVDPTYGGGGVLEGDETQPLSSGVATFGDLTVSESGVGYVLMASYSDLEVPSETFDIYDGLCEPNATCTASNLAGTQIKIEGFSETAGLSVGPNINTADCGSLTPLGSTFGIVPLDGAATDVYTATLTIPKPGLQGAGVSNIVVCASPTPEGTLAPLPICAKKKPFTEKCIISKTSSNAGDAVITMLFDGDPFGGGFS